jgi:hypothetical protein
MNNFGSPIPDVGQHYVFMKKLIPYILAYLIVAAGTAVYTHFSKHAYHNPYPPNSVTVITTLSHDELATKLQQVGLPEAQHIETMTVRPAPVLSLAIHFLTFAVY